MRKPVRRLRRRVNWKTVRPAPSSKAGAPITQSGATHWAKRERRASTPRRIDPPQRTAPPRMRSGEAPVLQVNKGGGREREREREQESCHNLRTMPVPAFNSIPVSMTTMLLQVETRLQCRVGDPSLDHGSAVGGVVHALSMVPVADIGSGQRRHRGKRLVSRPCATWRDRPGTAFPPAGSLFVGTRGGAARRHRVPRRVLPPRRSASRCGRRIRPLGR